MVLRKLTCIETETDEMIDVAVKHMWGKVLSYLLILIHPTSTSSRQTADSPHQKNETESSEGINSEGLWNENRHGHSQMPRFSGGDGRNDWNPADCF